MKLETITFYLNNNNQTTLNVRSVTTESCHSMSSCEAHSMPHGQDSAISKWSQNLITTPFPEVRDNREFLCKPLAHQILV